MRLDPIVPQAGIVIHAGVVLSVAAGKARYELTDGSVGGPARYLVPAPSTAAGDPSHTHTSAVLPARTPCLVILLAGRRSDAWVIPFPEEV